MISEIINQTLTNTYLEIREAIPEQYRLLTMLFVYTIIIAVYGIFVWKFYKFLAKRDVLEFNLSQYNRTEHPFWNKFWASVFFLLEYIIIIPVIIFFWFAVLALFLLILSKEQSVSQILLISASVIAAVRIVSYYSTDLSKDLAKLFPFTLLVVSLVEPNFFSVDRLISRFVEIPSLVNHILIYFVFILGLEILMRVLLTIFELIFGEPEEEE